MFRSFDGRLRQSGLSALVLALTTAAMIPPSLSRAQQGRVTLTGHIPPIIAQAQSAQRINAGEQIQLALSLPLRNQRALNEFLTRVSDPHDPLYGAYLTPEEFTARFGPTVEDYNRVKNFAKAAGLTVVGTHPNRTLLDVAGSAATLERAFAVHLMRYQLPNGTVHRAPDVEPSIPSTLAGRLTGIVGLEDAIRRPHSVLRKPDALGALGALSLQPHVGTGPNGGLAPKDIKTAYNLNGLSVNGSGQTLGLFELDGYKASDITAYESFFGLPSVPLQNVLVDGATGSAGSGAGEVTLDIELQIALAPGASKVIVYEGPNSSAGVVDTYNRIATDNLAKQISTSWGLYEAGSGSSTINSENTAFQQMAAQGQSIFAAAGDSGAYDNGSSLSVDDPASQPYMVGVGGTTLTTNGSGGSYSSEKTWNGGSVSAGAGGGGISSVWSIPSYQSPAGIITTASKGSTTKRNVPDVSLDADPNTGYAIYVGGAWNVYGGTSCAAPLWSAFTALVNQQRLANGSALLGFANPALYTVGTGASYTSNFHDIADGSTNLFYPAVTGFDDATGWGTFNGTNLLNTLAGPSGPPVTPAAPTGLTATAGNGQIVLTWNASSGATTYNLLRSTASGAEVSYKTGLTATTYTDTGLTNGTTYYYKVTATNTAGTSGLSSEASAKPVAISQLLGNPGFETGTASPWVATAGVLDNSTSEPAHSGSWKAWLDGYGTTHTDTLYQQVAIPSTITSATLTFWLHIDTAETTTTAANDTLKVQVRNSSGTVLATLATYSNLNKNTGYVQKSFDLSAYKGQTIRIYLVGVENSSRQTSFVVDDFALNVQ